MGLPDKSIPSLLPEPLGKIISNITDIRNKRPLEELLISETELWQRVGVETRLEFNGEYRQARICDR